MAEQQILGFPVKDAPNDRLTKDSETFELLAVRATFDGTAAGSSFVPAVVVISDAGEEVGTFPLGGSVAAGDTVAVTFAPFLRNDTGRAGIFYDTINTGDWLEVVTTGEGGNFGAGNGIILWAKNKGVVIDAEAGFSLFVDSGDSQFNLAGDLAFNVDGVSFFTFNDGVNMGFVEGLVMQIPTGKSITVQDNLASPIFRIDENGDLHGKTGKTLTFDL